MNKIAAGQKKASRPSRTAKKIYEFGTQMTLQTLHGTFWGDIVYLRPRSVICGPSAARDANDTTREQINNIPSKSHFIIIIINIQGQIQIFNKFYAIF